MKRYAVSFITIFILLVGLIFWNIGSGSISISWDELWNILLKQTEEGTAYHIIWDIRLPRILAAVMLGGALSISGFLLQTFFGNPIAGPYVLGISSGAKLMVALAMIYLLGRGIAISSFGMVAAAFAGSLLAMGFVLLISMKVHRMSLLIVCGILIGYICSAITDICVTFADDSNIVNLHNWSQGSFSGMNWSNILMIFILTLLSFLAAMFLAKPIGAYQMGETYARNMGVNITVLRVSLILLSSLLSACVTAFAGPISFVGIAVPHLIKSATGTAKPLVLIPGCFLGGAVVTLFCDGIARTLFAPTEVSISTVTAKFTVGYGKKIILSDVNLMAEPGRVLTLIGPNGSGKSTILKSIVKQLKSLGGVVYLNGKATSEMKEAEIAKSLSMVMTEHIHPELMSCRDVVATGRYPYTGRLGILDKQDWKLVDEAITMVHAEEVAEQSFTRISDGQRQRVMLARAICQDTAILVLDEPTSYLDIRYKLDILNSIRKLARERNIAVIMSLHELDLVQKVSDMVACVDGTTVSHIGPPEEIFQGSLVQKLYGIEEKNFDSMLGIMQMPGNKAAPNVFVIGGGGAAIPTYYRLQREHIPFAAGILFENDVEYPVATALASKVITAKAFYPMEEAQLEEAKKILAGCETCICTCENFGPYNMLNKELRSLAEEQGKLE